jgi:hypothetical protein
MGQRSAAALAGAPGAPGAARDLRFRWGEAKVAIFTPND